MLDSETRRRIDNLRDILVGKLPGPESQVEQITTALVYKFMHDMDQESIEFGGEPSFFVGDFEKYSWHHLFNPKLSGIKRVKLYSEAIENMYTNPAAPSLFREIFKNSFLPFKDPSTLYMFLKEISEFQYSHSEKLGDAFEYLLSFMGSQGDAGQFRTPRHIIDFIVEIVDPKKNETILDPSCGTAGFLISSYKHILKQNTSKKLGDWLTAEERKKLGDNLVGYDISPDMTRISLVNMYLHQFVSPRIYEYDTLSSDDRWNEYYDVILANPPFFSPKGGITPHSKFGVQSTRAEVLFVDYIMEHLKPRGRAGVIVPEGIIFQASKAYITLRKKLVENCLIGVVSLPPGVFQPYSGVKTSILFLDKELNKKSKNIFFVKVENDGFSLGAQRTQISKNDLPKVVKSYIDFSTGKLAEEDGLIAKELILEASDCSLSQGKYLSIISSFTSDFSMVKLGKVADFQNGYAFKPSDWGGIGKPIIRIQNLTKSANVINRTTLEVDSKYHVEKGDLLISWSATIGVFIWEGESALLNQHIFLVRPSDKILKQYLYFLGQKIKENIELLVHGNTMTHITKGKFLEIEIPLPPIEIQQEIVDELDGYQKIIDGCRQVVENYKPIIDIDPSWEMVELGKVVKINPQKSEVQKIDSSTMVSFIPMEDMSTYKMSVEAFNSKPIGEVYQRYTYFKDEDVLLAKVTPCFENGKAGIPYNLKNGLGFGSSEFFVLRSSDKVLPKWIYVNVTTNHFRKAGVLSFTGTSGLRRLPRSFVESYKIPVPSIDSQLNEIKRVEAEIEIIEGNQELINIYTQKIQDRISKVWGKNV